MRLFTLLTLLVPIACSDAAPAALDAADIADIADTLAPDVSDDVGDTSTPDLADTSDPDLADADSSEIETSDELPASAYCERSVDIFCPYYLRCGRIVAGDLDDCRATFLESCNARYEPLYRDLEARGLLTLSAAGLARCGARLATVACEDQIFDLDGCPDVWLGQVPDQGACGPGLESFVCGEASTCLIDLSFCGRCVPTTTGACDFDHRCPDDAVCREGACVLRVPVGAPCDETVPCVLGAACDGVCKAPTIVAVGEDCDQAHRCPYKSQCVSGRCVEYALVGEACRGETGCASGFCDAGTCAALRAVGDSCSAGPQCESGRCEAERCAPVVWSCVDR